MTQQVQSPTVWGQLFGSPFVFYAPEQIRQIRRDLGETRAEFGARFIVGIYTIQSWEEPEESPKHRECLGAAARLMYWAEKESQERGCRVGNQIRRGIRYGE